MGGSSLGEGDNFVFPLRVLRINQGSHASEGDLVGVLHQLAVLPLLLVLLFQSLFTQLRALA